MAETLRDAINRGDVDGNTARDIAEKLFSEEVCRGVADGVLSKVAPYRIRLPKFAAFPPDIQHAIITVITDAEIERTGS